MAATADGTRGAGGGNNGGSADDTAAAANGSAAAAAAAPLARPRSPAAARPPSALNTLLGLPVFFAMVFLMYWSLPFCAAFGYIPPWQLWGERNDIFYWCKFLVDAFRIDTRLIVPEEEGQQQGEGGGGGGRDKEATAQAPRHLGAGAPLYRGPGPVLYLANHRSWADFFLDAYLTGGRAQMLSRMAVLYAFPWFMAPIVVARGCVVFKRGSIADKDAFNRWLDSKIARSPAPGLVVYPEGHRSSLPHSLPLKRGMLHYAYGRKIPVQVVQSAGKERVISEKRRRAAWGGVVATAYAPPVFPADHPDFASFMAAVQASWDAAWNVVQPYADAPRARLLALPENRVVPELYRWPSHLQAAQAAFAAAGAVGMTATLWCWWRAALWLTSGALLAPLRPALLALWLAWVAASFVACQDKGGGDAGSGGSSGGGGGGAAAAASRKKD